MNKLQFKYFFAIIGLAFISSCNLFDQTEPALIVNLSDDIILDWRQVLDAQDQDKIEMTLTSKQRFDCFGMTFIHEIRIFDHVIDLNIEGISAPGFCDGEDLPAITNIRFPITKDRQNINIKIGDDIQTEGSIRKFSDRFTMNIPENHGLDAASIELKKVPAGLVWGKIISTDRMEEALSWWQTEFFSSNNESKLDSGYYGHFELTTSGLKVNLPSSEFPQLSIENGAPFLYELDESFEFLVNKVNAFNALFGDDAKVVCLLSNGERLVS